MKKQALRVSLEVSEPSVVELSVAEKVQLDRVSSTASGPVAERHGELLGPGVATLSLEPGAYFFKTLSDAHLEVVRGGVTAHPMGTGSKDPPPPPPPLAVPVAPDTRGDELAGETPLFTIR